MFKCLKIYVFENLLEVKLLFIHIGDNTIVPVKSIVGIFDLEGTTITGFTREFLRVAEEEGFVRTVSERMPKSFVITEQNGQSIVYISPLSVSTIKKRMNIWLDKNNNKGKFLYECERK